jgi:DNA repair ATPase RecN
MKDTTINHKKEFQELTENLSDAIYNMSDPVSIAAMLYTIAEEKKSSNLVVREINGKFDNILEKLDKVYTQLIELNQKLGETNSAKVEIPREEMLSDRDKEILDFAKKKTKVCADDIKLKFNYRGRNAASARLSKLFKENLLEKIYVGRKVYYKIKSCS